MLTLIGSSAGFRIVDDSTGEVVPYTTELHTVWSAGLDAALLGAVECPHAAGTAERLVWDAGVRNATDTLARGGWNADQLEKRRKRLQKAPRAR